MAWEHFTDEQREAVERRDGPLFLEAGAGTGKTSVLVERFIRAAREDDVPVESILAITFTEKAAAELKLRIRKRFLELDDRERARQAEGAFVSTIHGFCTRLLRAHPLAAGIDPEFHVLDESEAARLEFEAFESALERFVDEAGSGTLELVATYTPAKLERMARAVYARLRSRGEARPELPLRDDPPPADGKREALHAAAQSALTYLRPLAGENRATETALASVEACAAAVDELGDESLGDHERFARFGLKRGNVKALAAAEVEGYVEALEDFVAGCRARRELADYGLLRELVRLYGDQYARLKEARSGLDFADLELVARGLLEGSDALRERYQERFTHVLVDEFQDTNPLQDRLLELIAGEDGRLFCVGDEFQSIYLFRHADVRVFRERRSRARQADRHARLTGSFRARRELLDVLDATFASELGEGFVPLVEPPAYDRPARAVQPSVDVLMVDRDLKSWQAAGLGEDPFGASMRSVPLWRAVEARLLAKRIDELTGPAGPFAHGDAAVLLRAATDIQAYERALEERGVPTYVVGGHGYFSQQQVGDLRAYLAALANPRDELALYSLVASPLVGASVDALALVGQHAKDAHRDPWWELEEAFGEGGESGLANALDDGDRARLTEFVKRFRGERRAAPRISLESLIDRAVTASGYDRTVLAMPAGDRRMANVRKLMRLAREYERDEGRNLRGFLDYVADRDAVRAREGEAPLEGEDAQGVQAVRLMTIHAAKGLEFPLVAVADLGRRGVGDDDALRVAGDRRVGLQIASLGGGATQGMEMEAIRSEQDAEQDEEERRVFYVAMTRAQEHLIVSGATEAAKKPAPSVLGVPMRWAWRALAPDFWEAVADGGEGEYAGTWDGREFRVRCILCAPDTLDAVLGKPDSAPLPVETEPAGAELGPPPELVSVEASEPLPVGRLSYSGLEDYRRCGYRFYLQRVLGMAPAAEESLEAAAPGLSALARGSIVHGLLERLDFARPQIPSEEEIDAQITAFGVDALPGDATGIRELVERFAASPLRERIAGAARPRTELPFAFELDTGDGRGALLVNGVVDVWADEGEPVLIVDYKSDAVEPEADLPDLCERKYGVQRLVYALAALRSGAQSVEVVHCFLERADEPVTATFEASSQEALERELRELAAGVVQGGFAVSDDPHRELCLGCPGRRGLCSWEPERTLAELPAAQG